MALKDQVAARIADYQAQQEAIRKRAIEEVASLERKIRVLQRALDALTSVPENEQLVDALQKEGLL